MNFLVYDLLFLVVFGILVSLFLYRRKKNIQREGILVLYRTTWGINLINKIGKRWKKTLTVLSYISITVGYALMATIIYLFGKIVWLYVFNPTIVSSVKVPPVAPLIPYLPQLFKLDFLPNFYFTYWIVILAIIAIFHEMAHGIFAAKDNIKIKKTGFGFFPSFLPIFPLAFVEPDQKQMEKKSKFSQMAVLSAGTFANVLTAIFFLFIMWGFSALAFAPGGVTFDSYAQATIDMDNILTVNGVPLTETTYDGILGAINEEGLNTIETTQGTFVITKNLLELPGTHIEDQIQLYFDSPAIRADLQGPILAIDGQTITSLDILTEVLSEHTPGDEVKITTKEDGVNVNQSIVLGEHPVYQEIPWLGIAFFDRSSSGILAKVYTTIVQFRDPYVYYEPLWGELSTWIYDLLWWIILISFSVALMNMLPVGIFDGGRFFYLTILGITRSEKIAARSFRFVTRLAVFLLLLLMVFWLLNLF